MTHQSYMWSQLVLGKLRPLGHQFSEMLVRFVRISLNLCLVSFMAQWVYIKHALLRR